MAVATLTVNYLGYPLGNDNTQRNQIRRGTFSISTGGTYPPGGFPINWNSEGNKSIPFNSANPSTTGTIQPVDVDVKSTAYNTSASGANGIGPSGYIYIWDSVQGNLHIFESANGGSGNSGPLIELGGNIPSTVVNDVIRFTAVFSRND